MVKKHYPHGDEGSTINSEKRAINTVGADRLGNREGRHFAKSVRLETPIVGPPKS